MHVASPAVESQIARREALNSEIRNTGGILPCLGGVVLYHAFPVCSTGTNGSLPMQFTAVETEPLGREGTGKSHGATAPDLVVCIGFRGNSC